MSNSEVIRCPTDNCPVHQFTEELLLKEPRWYTLGIFLGVPTRELDAIGSNHSQEGTTKCLVKMHNYLQSTGKPLSWEKISSSLWKMDNCDLARCISKKYSPLSLQLSSQKSCDDSGRQPCSLSSESSSTDSLNHDESLRESLDTSREAITDISVEIKTDFLNLTQLFPSLVSEIGSAFRNSNIPLQNLQMFIEEECELAPFLEQEATLENVFSRIQQHYSLLNYTLLEYLVQTFLSENDALLQKLSAYTEVVNRFKSSTNMADLSYLVGEPPLTTGQCKIVKLKLREFWRKIRLRKFEKMVMEILGVLYNSLSQISVARGCICVSWVIPDMADLFGLIPPRPLEFIKAIGIVSLHIGDSVVYDIPGEGCEVMEAAMLQAIELKSTRAVEVLLAAGCDPEVATYCCGGSNLVTNIVNIRDSSDEAGSIEHVCVFGPNQNVEEIVDSSGEDEREMEEMIRGKMHCSPLVEDGVLSGCQEVEATDSSLRGSGPPILPSHSYVHSKNNALEKTQSSSMKCYKIEDFKLLKVIGKGCSAKVFLAQLIGEEPEHFYAIKALRKDLILEDDDVDGTFVEKRVVVLGSQHPFLTHLLCTFHSPGHLFFVMEYLSGGDLVFHVHASQKFDLPRARFYAAEIVCALQFLHRNGIIYRDLKLDNVLLDHNGHIKLIDFGMSKEGIFGSGTSSTLCGTPDYMAPEIIEGHSYSHSVDFWSLGVLSYEMMMGQSPFNGENEEELFRSICNSKVSFPSFMTLDTLDYINKLLERDPLNRLGCIEDREPVRKHPFFATIDWDKLEARQVEPPFKPKVKSKEDVSNFDANFTSEEVVLTPSDNNIIATVDQSIFTGFSYSNDNFTQSK